MEIGTLLGSLVVFIIGIAFGIAIGYDLSTVFNYKRNKIIDVTNSVKKGRK